MAGRTVRWTQQQRQAVLAPTQMTEWSTQLTDWDIQWTQQQRALAGSGRLQQAPLAVLAAYRTNDWQASPGPRLEHHTDVLPWINHSCHPTPLLPLLLSLRPSQWPSQ